MHVDEFHLTSIDQFIVWLAIRFDELNDDKFRLIR